MEMNEHIDGVVGRYLVEQKYYEEDYDTIKINIYDLLLSKKSLLGAFNNIRHGDRSQSRDKPLDVWKNNNGLLFLTDGYHRVFEYLLFSNFEQYIIVVGEGYSDYYAEPKGDNLFKVQPNMLFNGLEDIISIQLLKMLKQKISK